MAAADMPGGMPAPPAPPPPPPAAAPMAMADAPHAGAFAADAREAAKPAEPVWAPVREFPAPSYAGAFDGPRTDFRETIFWKPSIQSDEHGRAQVEFYLSD